MVYIDSEYKCHTTNTDGTFREVKKDLFPGKCAEFVEGYRYIPPGETWTRHDGVVFKGEMTAPWKPYVELDAVQRKAIRDALDQLAVNATDAVASAVVIAYPKLKEKGSLISAGTRINWKGTLKRAAVDLWDRPENNPDNAPTLWEDINYRAGHRIIPDVITVGLAFAKGETGWEGDVLYRSKKDANVYPPSVRPEDWEVVE